MLKKHLRHITQSACPTLSLMMEAIRPMEIQPEMVIEDIATDIFIRHIITDC